MYLYFGGTFVASNTVFSGNQAAVVRFLWGRALFGPWGGECHFLFFLLTRFRQSAGAVYLQGGGAFNASGSVFSSNSAGSVRFLW